MRTLDECESYLQRGNECVASVQDKVPALNIVGKLYTPLTQPLDRRLLNKHQDVQTNKVQNKEIWSHIITALQAQVKVEQHLKSHDNCFLGSDAVDVIQDYLTQNKVLGMPRPPGPCCHSCARQGILLFSYSTPVKPDHVLDLLMEKLDLTRLVGSPPTDCLPPAVCPDLLYTSNYLNREVLKAFKESQ
ncbi:hypothetical protein cypCar_00041654 [Cyprinus carpio]|nr:hypothetical protein cypCar_00041654 [Cyprinus carpio]